MQKIKSIEQLKIAIQQLEYAQSGEWVMLKEQLFVAAQTLKPLSIIRNIFKDAVSQPDLKTTVINVVLGLATGFVTNKIFPGKTTGPLAKLIVGTIAAMTTTGQLLKKAIAVK
jgi:hypothetical protein